MASRTPLFSSEKQQCELPRLHLPVDFAERGALDYLLAEKAMGELTLQKIIVEWRRGGSVVPRVREKRNINVAFANETPM